LPQDQGLTMQHTAALTEVLEQLVAAIEDLEMAYVQVPPSLRKATASLRLIVHGEQLPNVRPPGQS
jgi:hypothetical protein